RHLRPQLDRVAERHPAGGAENRHGDGRVDRLAVPLHPGRQLRALQHDPLLMTPSRRPRSPGFSTAEVLVGMTLSLLAVGTLYSFPAGGRNFRYFAGSNPPNERVPAGTPPHFTPEQRDCVTKVRVTVRANLPNPYPRLTTPVTSVAESEIAIRNRSLANF